MLNAAQIIAQAERQVGVADTDPGVPGNLERRVAALREMRAIRAGLGIDTPEDVACSVGDWHASNPKNTRGKNDYSLSQYGLDLDAVREQFALYSERFGIPTEAEGLARIVAS